MYPRSAHTHSGLVEFVYVISGQGEYEIDNVRYPVRAGDLVIYNSDTVHCEFVNHNMLPILCCAAEGILLPGQKPDCMIENGVSPVFHLDEKSYMFRQLMQMIFDEALRGNRYSHMVCQSLFESLFYLTLDVIRQGNEKSAVWGRPETASGIRSTGMWIPSRLRLLAFRWWLDILASANLIWPVFSKEPSAIPLPVISSRGKSEKRRRF